MLRCLALRIMDQSDIQDCTRNMIDPYSQSPLHSRITPRRIHDFNDRYLIVRSANTIKHGVSPVKDLHIEQEAAVHLGALKKILSSREIYENDLSNADGTHIIINMDNGIALGFSDERDITYAYVVSGGEGITILVMFIGGIDARIKPAFMIFTNKDRRYPVRKIPNKFGGVRYRTGSKGGMYRAVILEFIKERRVIRELQNSRTKILFLDNCNGHSYTEEYRNAESEINAEIRFLPPKETDLVQPCDSLVCKKSRWCCRKGGGVQNGHDSIGKVGK